MEIQKIQIAEEEKRNTISRDVARAKEKMDYEDYLARQRIDYKKEKDSQLNFENMQHQERLIRKQEELLAAQEESVRRQEMIKQTSIEYEHRMKVPN